jgi:SAM-dependent methyltransferase
LSKGAAKYYTIDVNDLVGGCPPQLYDLFFEYLKLKEPESDISFLREQLTLHQQGLASCLNFTQREDFNIELAFEKESVDVVFSQAAFEHFDDVSNTVQQLSAVTRSGGVAVIQIDLKTHTRLIRAKDPLNIYRYSPSMYRLFNFRGMPNRVRPFQYKEFFEQNGWVDFHIFALSTLNAVELELITPHLFQDYQDERNQMHYLSIMICARKR